MPARPTTLEETDPDIADWYNRCMSYIFSPNRNVADLADEGSEIYELVTHHDLELPRQCCDNLQERLAIYMEFLEANDQ